MYTMDGLLGLPRKKSAGISYNEPLIQNPMFGDQSSVDQFVSESNPKWLTTVRSILYRHV